MPERGLRTDFPGALFPKFYHETTNPQVVRLSTKASSLPSVLDLSCAPRLATLESDMAVVGCAPGVKTFIVKPRASSQSDIEDAVATLSLHLPTMAELVNFALVIPPIPRFVEEAACFSLASLQNRLERLDLSRAYSLPYAVCVLRSLPASGAAFVRLPSALVQWKSETWAKTGLGADADEGIGDVALLAKSKCVKVVCVTGVGQRSDDFTRARGIFERSGIAFACEFEPFC